MVRGNLYKKQMKLLPVKGTLGLIFILWARFPDGVHAQLLTDIPIAPEPVGSGARALGQSAFIAVADDATAASWNPAGLINLERPEASFVGAWKAISNDPSSADNNISYSGNNWGESEINFMSYAQPIENANPDVVISANYHQVYDLGLHLNWATSIPANSTKVRSDGAISAYSLAGAVSVPSYSAMTVGASFNLYTQSLLNDYARQATTTERRERRFGQPVVSSITETLDDFRGYNFTFGLLWDVYERQENLLTLGIVCHTPFTAKVNQEGIYISSGKVQATYGPSRLDIDFPLSLGGGVNYRFSDKLSAAFDVEWKDWSEYKYTGVTSTPSDTQAYRLGGEYLFFEGAKESVLACRGGIFYEPRPVWDDTLSVYGLSAGLGWTVRERFSLDFAYQFRWGQEDLTVRNTNIDYGIEEHLFVTSLIIYF